MNKIMIKIIPALLLFLLLAFISSGCLAKDKPGLGVVLFAGLSAGGDDLLDEAGLFNTSGGRQGAGELLYGEVGFIYEFSNLPLTLQTSIGLKANSIDFLLISGLSIVDGKSTLTSIPLDLLAFYRISDNIRIGGGLSFHLGPQWELCLPSCSTTEFDDAIGVTLEVDADLKHNVFIGGRLTLIEYESVFDDINASHIGAHMGLRF